MGDEQEGPSLLGHQFEKVFLELAPCLFVDRRKRFVHEQHLGIDGKRPCEADALAHAAGEFVRIGVFETLETHACDVFLRHSLAFRAGQAFQLETEGDIAHDAGPRHQREILEHEGAFRSRAGDLAAVDIHLAGRRRNEAGDDLEKRRLAATGRTQKRCELPLGKVDGNIIEGLDAAIVNLRDVPDFHDRPRAGGVFRG